MTDDQLSRASILEPSPVEVASPATSAPDAPTNLLEVKRRIRTMKLKPAKRRDEIVSALNTIARAVLPSEMKKPTEEQMDAALARVSVHARYLMPKFDRRVGARLDYTSRAAWRNVPWLVKKALKLTGAWSLFQKDHIPLSGDWKIVAEKSPRLSYIRLLGHWGMLIGLMPRDFGGHHLPAFLEWLLTWKARDYALRCYFAALGDWNRGARAHPDWPGRPVVVVTRLTGHYSVALELWSQKFLDDVTRVIDILRHPDPDEELPFEPISERVAAQYRQRLLRTMSAYVAARQLDPSTIMSVADLLAPDAAKAALDFMIRWIQRKKPDVKRTSEVHGSAKLLATIAERCYRPPLPAETILRLQKMARARSPVRKG